MSTAFERATDAVHRHWGVAATYHPRDGAAVEVTVVERRPESDAQLFSRTVGLSPAAQVTARYLGLRASQVPIAQKDDEIVIGDLRFVVADRPTLDRIGGEWLLPLREVKS